MSSEGIRAAIEGAVAYLSTHPDEARYTDSYASATVEHGLRVAVRGPDGARLTTDMPPSVGGGNSAPSPGWLLRAAEASCVATLIAMRAAQLELQPETIEVTVDSQSDDRGILGIDASTPAGPLATRLVARVAGPGLAAEQVEQLVHWAVDHCPVTDAVRRSIPFAIEVDG